jgi:glycosyltransferase involved in cell wall biosynthesis
MEGLVARIEAEDEVGEARDRGPSSLHLRSGTTSVGHRVRAGDFSEESRGADRGVVLVVPLVPAPGGNGLAMRAGMLLEALAGRCDVDLVIVPVSGAVDDMAWAARLARSVTVLSPVGGAQARVHVTAQLADPVLRDLLARSAPLPARAMAAPPTLAGDALRRMRASARPPRAVVVLRGYLAPFGCTLSRLLDAGRTVIDLDDDDETLARSYGDGAEADAVGRLARVWLPGADVVCAASPQEAAAMATRYELSCVHTLPNAVHVPAPVAVAPGDHRLLFVGNLTYAPNVEAARVLAAEILPRVQAQHPDVTLDLVGPHAGALAQAPGVRVAGHVDDLRPWYSGADVVVVPLWHGGGTRIKVLEAFAYRRPVVATPLAVGGIDVRDRREVLLADSSPALAQAVTTLLDDPPLGVRLAESAARMLEARYALSAVAPLVWDLVAGEGAQQSSRPLERSRYE